MPVDMSPLKNVHLMHISWVRGCGQLELCPHISVGFFQKSKVCVPAAQKKSKIILFLPTREMPIEQESNFPFPLPVHPGSC